MCYCCHTWISAAGDLCLKESDFNQLKCQYPFNLESTINLYPIHWKKDAVTIRTIGQLFRKWTEMYKLFYEVTYLREKVTCFHSLFIIIWTGCKLKLEKDELHTFTVSSWENPYPLVLWTGKVSLRWVWDVLSLLWQNDNVPLGCDGMVVTPSVSN